MGKNVHGSVCGSLTILCTLVSTLESYSVPDHFATQRNGWHTINLSGMLPQLPIMTAPGYLHFTLTFVFGLFQKKP